MDFDALRSVFSRSGFTTGYFDDKIDKTMFGVRQKEDVVSAQGVLGDLAKLYGKEAPRVRVDFDFQLEAGEPAALAARDEDGNAAFAQGDVPQIAENKPTTQEKVAQSLAKTGGTPYYLGELTRRHRRGADPAGVRPQCHAPPGAGGDRREAQRPPSGALPGCGAPQPPQIAEYQDPGPCGPEC